MTNNFKNHLSNRPVVYLAGPDVFRPDAIAYGAHLKSICEKYGFVGLYPFDNDTEASGSADIYMNNVKLLRSADFVIANMQSFHGPSMDVGTVWEIGFAVALGIQVIGYMPDRRTLREKIEEHYGPLIDGKTKDGMGFDDFGLVENLMISESVKYVVNSFEDAVISLREYVTFVEEELKWLKQ